ncbi:MAG TPA: TonB-dependent receptor, partial [Pyrinomonadaceae bacterium]
MKKFLKLITGGFAVSLCFAALAFGQGTTGSIEGTITDRNNAVVPNATVTVESTGTTAGYNRTVTANANGYVNIPNMPPGTYRVTVRATNFADKVVNVNVVVDRAASINTALEVAGTTVDVDVVADSNVQVDITDTKIDTNITKQIIDSLPRGTNFSSLLKIAPNVRPEANAGGFQIDGASGSENVFVIDGQEVTNFATGSLDSNNNLPYELLQEVQIKSTGFEAEYGGATGGVINAITAGGNNAFRGNFGISFRASELQGRPNLVLNQYGTAAGQFDYFRPNKDGGTDFFPVASFSGPIVKNKVWFKADYAPQFFETNRRNDYYDTDAPDRAIVMSETFRAKTRREYAFARIDAQPISSLRLFGTFLWNPVINDGLLPGSTEGLSVSSPNISPETYSLRGGRRNSNSYNGQATWTPNNWMVLNFRHGRSFQNEKLGSYGLTSSQRFGVSTGSPINPCDQASFNWPGTVPYCRGFNTGSNDITVYDVSTRTTYDADATFVGLNAGGRHNIKVGYQRNELFNDVDSGYTSSGYTLLYIGLPLVNASGLQGLPLCDFQNINPNDTTCSLGAARLIRIGTAGKASSDNDAIFAQDSWQIANRLTINFGVRFENEIVPSFGDPATTVDIKFGWGDKIAPRFGAAYDLTGDGKTKL